VSKAEGAQLPIQEAKERKDHRDYLDWSHTLFYSGFVLEAEQRRFNPGLEVMAYQLP